MLERIRQRYKETQVRSVLMRHSQRWWQLGASRQTAFEQWNRGDDDPWTEYLDLRNGLIARIAWLVRVTPPLRDVARDLEMHEAELVAAYSILVRRCRRPSAVQPYHLPTALMLLPSWLEVVCALYKAGRLEEEAADLETALIELDQDSPLLDQRVTATSNRLANGALV